jgi:phosphoglycolate phosphatase
MSKPISVVITDLDNTLYDWLEMWYQSFHSMLVCLVEKSGVDQQTLETEIRTVFQRHGTSEYAFLIESLPSLQSRHPGEDLVNRYQTAIQAYNQARYATLQLYPSVYETLNALKQQKGCTIVVYTESRAFYTLHRMKNLKLDGLIDYLYSPPDHELPTGYAPETIRYYPQHKYVLHETIHRHTTEGEYKPNPHILQEIIEEIHATPEQCVYIGDSQMKDIAMAQDALVTDVHAKYGESQHKAAYELLRRVSHWTDADIERERQLLQRGNVSPTYVLRHSFAELLELPEIAFVPHRS